MPLYSKLFQIMLFVAFGFVAIEGQSETLRSKIMITINKVKKSDRTIIAVKENEVSHLLKRLIVHVKNSENCSFDAKFSLLTDVNGISVPLEGPYDTENPLYHAGGILEVTNICSDNTARVYLKLLNELHEKELIYLMSNPSIEISPSVSGRN